ncbi:hypothetical protein ACF07Q_28540 [Nocardiopsis dassonvillei]|uniref:hypothetical protein n=1 Tax=Nocardiopsis dassonvillei TaxID=2014 RepID=UPI00370342B9
MTPDATTIGMWVIGAAAVITALLIIGRFIRMAWQAGRRLGHFLDDWFGEPPRDGVPGRPGIPARIGALEETSGQMCERLGAVDSRVQRVEHELHPNSGSSLRDAVDRVEREVSKPQPAIQQTFVTPPPDPVGE